MKADAITRERYDQVMPAVGSLTRLRMSLKQQLTELAVAVLRRIPPIRKLVDYPNTQPLHSGSVKMYRWYNKPYGSHDKPRSLAEIPWDYVEQNQDEIPFAGLREFWYPAMMSGDLPNNVPKPLTLLGDNLVFFRDNEGKPRALENRCPHRGPLLSLGQVGVWKPGTLTCRYHGMTFDGKGECVAFLADGPDTTALGKYHAKSYPVEEYKGIIFAYMGDEENPKSFEDSHPHAKSVLAQDRLVVAVNDLPYSYLNILDNTVDMVHVGCLHRSCMLFGGQKSHTGVAYDELPEGEGGLHVYCKGGPDHVTSLNIDEITWYLPNLVYHGPGEVPGMGAGWFWFVPRDVGNFTSWLIIGAKSTGRPVKDYLLYRLMNFMVNAKEIPGTSCFFGGDVPMQMSQGRIPRWDLEHLTRTDRAVVKVRKMLMDAHKAEVAKRGERGIERRLHRPVSAAT